VQVPQGGIWVVGSRPPSGHTTAAATSAPSPSRSSCEPPYQPDTRPARAAYRPLFTPAVAARLKSHVKVKKKRIRIRGKLIGIFLISFIGWKYFYEIGAELKKDVFYGLALICFHLYLTLLVSVVTNSNSNSNSNHLLIPNAHTTNILSNKRNTWHFSGLIRRL